MFMFFSFRAIRVYVYVYIHTEILHLGHVCLCRSVLNKSSLLKLCSGSVGQYGAFKLHALKHPATLQIEKNEKLTPRS